MTSLQIQTPKALERYVIAAHDAGLSRDQIEGFVKYGYVAQPKQLLFHHAARQCNRFDGPLLIVLGGTRNSAKTHSIFAQVALDDCQEYPGLKVLFLRHLRKAASESFDDLSAKTLRYCAHNKTSDRITFPNGSRILIGGYKDEADIDNYLGIEYDIIVIEECSQLTQNKLEKINGSLRTSRADGFRVRQYWSFNPGGIGYSYIKRRVVEPWKLQRERDTRFFFCHYKDNKFCDATYVAYLEGLEGPLAASWRDGDLDSFEGAALPNWDATVHVVEPFPIPSHWPRWRSVDYGYNPDPFSCHYYARDINIGRIYVYRELYGTGYVDSQQAQWIADSTPPDEAHMIAVTYAGADMFSTRTTTDRTGKPVITTNADEYTKKGIFLTQGDTDHVRGLRKINRIMGLLPDGKPGLQIFSTCPHMIRTLPQLVLKPGIEHIADGQEDHAFDDLRYGLTNYQDVAPPKPQPEQRRQSRGPLESAGDIL
jgi:phage terminase large subunit